MQADASKIDAFLDKEFDFSVLSLAMHQFPDDVREIVFKEAMRISKNVIIADYAYPQPTGFYGKMIGLIERIAGIEHYSSFKSYLKRGGISGLPLYNGFVIKKAETFGKGVFVIGIFSTSIDK